MVSWRRTFLALVMLMFSVAALRAASYGENRAYASAEKSFQDGIWMRAEMEFALFLERYPKSERRAEAILFQAQALFHQGNSPAVIKLLTSNVEAAGKFGDEYQFWIAEAYYQQGDFPKSVEAYVELQRRFALSPRRVEALVGEAAAHARLTNWTRVTAMLGNAESEFAGFARSQQTNRHVAHGLLLLADAQLELKNYPAVEAALGPLAGRSLDPALGWRAERLRYFARLAQGSLPEALAASSNLVVLATNVPDDRAAVLSESVALRADVLERSGQRAEARAVLEKNLVPGTPPSRQEHALLKITELALGEGRLAEANDTLVRFLNQSSNSPVAAVALLSLGEIHLRQSVGLLQTNRAAPTPEATNHLEAALGLFDRLVSGYTNSPLLGRAELNRGWGFWLKGQVGESAAAFERAATRLGDSEDQVVARFKLGDALFAQKDYARALPAYQAAAEALARWPRLREPLNADLFQQILRTSLELTNASAATAAMDEILKQQPRGETADRSLLILVQKLSDLGRPELARAEYEKFVALAPDFSRRAEVELVLGRAREQQGDWAAAIAGYEHWLAQFPTNTLRPQVEYQLGWANFRAGFETNAFHQFTNFVAQYPTHELSSQVQWWVAGWFYRRDFPRAEQNYKAIFQTWPQSPLAREARMMAGRAAYFGDRYETAIEHFTSLTSDANTPTNLWMQAMLGYGSALMSKAAPETNRYANFEEAIRVFGQMQLRDPTHELALLANLEKAKCWVQLGERGSNFAWLAFSQVITSEVAGVTARSEALVGRGQALEAAAQRVSGLERTNLLWQALNDYLDVVHETNLREGEQRDPLWVKKAGLVAGPLLEGLGAWIQAEKLYVRLQELLPPLRASFQRRIEQARERRLAEKKETGI